MKYPIDRALLATGLALLAIGLVMGAVTTYLAMPGVKLTTDGIVTTGVVARFHCSKGEQPSCAAVIEFVDRNGHPQTFEEPNEDATPRFRDGTRVEIVYTARGDDGIEYARLNRLTSLWTRPVITGLLASVFGAAGVFLAFHALVDPRRKRLRWTRARAQTGKAS